MKLAKLLGMFALGAILWAADPTVGTWKLNSAKSKYRVGMAPKEQTLTIGEAGNDLDVMVTGTSAEGTPISTHYTVPAAGGPGKIIESSYEAVSGKRMSANEREVTYTKAGKIALTVHSRVSGDGKTLTVTVKGTDTQGKPVDAVAVYDKQ